MHYTHLCLPKQRKLSAILPWFEFGFSLRLPFICCALHAAMAAEGRIDSMDHRTWCGLLRQSYRHHDGDGPSRWQSYTNHAQKHTWLVLGVAKVCVDANCFPLSHDVTILFSVFLCLSISTSVITSLWSPQFVIPVALIFLFLISLDAHTSAMFLGSQRPAQPCCIPPLHFLFIIHLTTSHSVLCET